MGEKSKRIRQSCERKVVYARPSGRAQTWRAFVIIHYVFLSNEGMSATFLYHALAVRDITAKRAMTAQSGAEQLLKR